LICVGFVCPSMSYIPVAKSLTFAMPTSATGGELLDYIVQTKVLTEAIAVKYLSQMISALQYMHDVGVAHMDIRVSNNSCVCIIKNVYTSCSQKISYYQPMLSQ